MLNIKEELRKSGQKIDLDLYSDIFFESLQSFLDSFAANKITFELQKANYSNILRYQVLLMNVDEKVFAFISIDAKVNSKGGADEYYQANLDFQDFCVQRKAFPINITEFHRLEVASYLQFKGIDLINKASERFAQARGAFIFDESLMTNVTIILADFAFSLGDKNHVYKVKKNFQEGWSWLFGEIANIVNDKE
jgi:hypothetical protein